MSGQAAGAVTSHQLSAGAVVMDEHGSDADLARRCLAGDVDAFAPLVGRYQRVLFNTALRLVGNAEDARDVTQTAFVKAFEKLASFDPERKFFSWIYRIMMNESLNLVRARRPQLPLDSCLPAPGGDPQRHVQCRELGERVQAALASLPAEQREAVVLRHFAELSYAEMSLATGVPETTVKSRLYAARQRLLALLRGGGP